jgi:hypothetical protein
MAALFESLRAQGVTTIRWFLLCDGRAGLRFDEDGSPLGLDDVFWRDVDTALDWLTAAGLGMIPVLIDFHWARPRRVVNGVQLGGRRHLLSSHRGRRMLLDRVVVPIFERYGEDPRIHAWDLINEPEWITFGAGLWNPFAGIWRRHLRAYVREAAMAAHTVASQPVTVGSASTRWLWLVQGLGLDFYQPHWYDRFERRSPLTVPVAALGCDAPVVLGEFPTRGSARPPLMLLDTARRAGYHGAILWSVLADDDASDFASLSVALRDGGGDNRA